MNNDILIISRVKMPIRLFLIIVSFSSVIFALLSVSNFYEKEKIINIFIVSLPVLLFSIYTFMWAIRKTVNIGPSFVKTTVFKTKKIEYKNVEHVGIYKKQLEIKAGKVKISINSEIEKQEEIIKRILEKIDFNSGKIVVVGNKDEINKYTPTPT